MSVTKYPSITVELGKNIRNGFYYKKVPTTRELALKYNVSRQTITNALRPLIEKAYSVKIRLRSRYDVIAMAK